MTHVYPLVALQVGAAVFAAAMAAQDWVIIISAVGVVITTAISAIGTLLLTLKQIPQVHKLVNTSFTEQKEINVALREQIEQQHATALAKSERHEVPPPPTEAPAGSAILPQQIVTIKPTGEDGEPR